MKPRLYAIRVNLLKNFPLKLLLHRLLNVILTVGRFDWTLVSYDMFWYCSCRVLNDRDVIHGNDVLCCDMTFFTWCDAMLCNVTSHDLMLHCMITVPWFGLLSYDLNYDSWFRSVFSCRVGMLYSMQVESLTFLIRYSYVCSHVLILILNCHQSLLLRSPKRLLKRN